MSDQLELAMVAVAVAIMCDSRVESNSAEAVPTSLPKSLNHMEPSTATFFPPMSALQVQESHISMQTLKGEGYSDYATKQAEFGDTCR